MKLPSGSLAVFIKLASVVCLIFAVLGCSPKQDPDPARRTAFELLQSDDFWNLAFGDAFADGGSATLSFINSDGAIIHLWAQAPTSRERQFFLKRFYSDPKAVEIPPNSPIEKRVLELLSSHHRRDSVNIPESYAQHFTAMLRDRQRRFPDIQEWNTAPK
ncbi:MAG TPA: hypothetical protein VF585_03495 [Chthoniobacterales bacterium]|jgi:hypothetical protein